MPFIRSHKTRTSQRRPRFVLLGLALACLAAALFGAVGASANPSIQEKRAQAQTILVQVQELDAQAGDAAERWNGANYKLGQIAAELQATQADLVRAKRGVRISQARVGARLRDLYVNGESASAVEVLLGAKSLTEILDGLEMRSRITAQDVRIAKELKTYRERTTARKLQLAQARTTQAEVVRQRANEQATIEANLVERKQLLSSVQAEVQRLVAEEQARQAELRRQAQIRLVQEQAAAAASQRAADAVAKSDTAQAAPPPSQSADTGTPADTGAPVDTPIPVAPPADASKGAQVVSIAMQYLGIPYVWGGASPSAGFDCSGLTMYVFAQVGVSLPHYAAAQYGMGVPVSKDQLQPGDLVFFHGLGHMGMYIGGGNFIHAPHTGDVVKISSLYEAYYASTWVGARRVL